MINHKQCTHRRRIYLLNTKDGSIQERRPVLQRSETGVARRGAWRGRAQQGAEAGHGVAGLSGAKQGMGSVQRLSSILYDIPEGRAPCLLPHPGPASNRLWQHPQDSV